MLRAMADDSYDRRELAALLEWYVESGVDITLDEAPHDRYADSLKPAPEPEPVVAPEPAPRPRAAPVRPVSTPRPEPAFLAPDEAVRAAEEAAEGAQTLEELAARLAAFEHAHFRDMARHFVFGAGAPGASLMALDVAPGEAEETSGEAFCGPEARLLDNMLKAIGRNRETASLGYLSPWRPPGRAALTPQQTAIFAPFLRRRIELARPELLLLFGEATARAALATNETLNRLRGRPHEARCGAHVAKAFVFPALDALLKISTLKPGAWRDLREASRGL